MTLSAIEIITNPSIRPEAIPLKKILSFKNIKLFKIILLN